METAQSWIGNGPNGRTFAEMWRDWRLLAQACLAQGKVLSAARILDAHLSLEAVAAIPVGDGLTISAIEGEPLFVDAIRSSVARCLGLPVAGLLAPL